MRLDRVFLRFLKIVFTLENPKKKRKKNFLGLAILVK